MIYNRLIFKINVVLLGLLLSISVLAETPRGLVRQVTQDNYRALVIGNNNYQDPKGRWQVLETAVADAQSVSEILETDYGFTDVTLLTNASRREIINALAALAKRTQAGDSVVVFYAGHGHLDEWRGQGFWIPVDAIAGEVTSYIRNSAIRDEISVIASRAKHTLLISDSCFSGALLREGARGKQRGDNSERYYQKVANKKSVQILAAGGFEFVDDNYRGSGHSPFTYFLLNELKHNNSNLLTASELAFNVEKAVANNVEQTPESGVLQGAGDELGEFIFARLDTTLPPIEPISPSPITTVPPREVPIVRLEKKRPFWKNPWFWVGTLTATAAAGYALNRGGSSSDDGDVVYQ